MTKTQAIQTQLKGLATIADMRSGKIVPTLKAATGSRIHYLRTKKGLPAVALPGEPYPVIRFVPDDVRKWAQKNRELLAARRSTKSRRKRA